MSNSLAISLPKVRKKKKKPMGPETKDALFWVLFSVWGFIFAFTAFFLVPVLWSQTVQLVCACLHAVFIRHHLIRFIKSWKRDQSDD